MISISSPSNAGLNLPFIRFVTFSNVILFDQLITFVKVYWEVSALLEMITTEFEHKETNRMTRIKHRFER